MYVIHQCVPLVQKPHTTIFYFQRKEKFENIKGASQSTFDIMTRRKVTKGQTIYKILHACI
jgi:hypothetical protein